jgi:hypothetical protein
MRIPCTQRTQAMYPYQPRGRGAGGEGYKKCAYPARGELKRSTLIKGRSPLFLPHESRQGRVAEVELHQRANHLVVHDALR